MPQVLIASQMSSGPPGPPGPPRPPASANSGPRPPGPPGPPRPAAPATSIPQQPDGPAVPPGPPRAAGPRGPPTPAGPAASNAASLASGPPGPPRPPMAAGPAGPRGPPGPPSLPAASAAAAVPNRGPSPPVSKPPSRPSSPSRNNTDTLDSASASSNVIVPPMPPKAPSRPTSAAPSRPASRPASPGTSPAAAGSAGFVPSVHTSPSASGGGAPPPPPPPPPLAAMAMGLHVTTPPASPPAPPPPPASMSKLSGGRKSSAASLPAPLSPGQSKPPTAPPSPGRSLSPQAFAPPSAPISPRAPSVAPPPPPPAALTAVPAVTASASTPATAPAGPGGPPRPPGPGAAPAGPAGPGGPPRPPGPGAAPAGPAGPGGPPRPPGPGAAPAAPGGPGGLLAAIQGFKKDELKQSDDAAAASASSPSDSKPASTPSAAPGPGPAGPRPMGPAGPPRPPGPGAAPAGPAGPGGPPRPPGPGAAPAAPAGPGGLLAAIQGFKKDELKQSNDSAAAASASSPSDSKPASAPSPTLMPAPASAAVRPSVSPAASASPQAQDIRLLFSDRLQRVTKAVSAGLAPDMSDLKSLSTDELAEYRRLLVDTVRRQRDQLASQLSMSTSSQHKPQPSPVPVLSQPPRSAVRGKTAAFAASTPGPRAPGPAVAPLSATSFLSSSGVSTGRGAAAPSSSSSRRSPVKPPVPTQDKASASQYPDTTKHSNRDMLLQLLADPASQKVKVPGRVVDVDTTALAAPASASKLKSSRAASAPATKQQQQHKEPLLAIVQSTSFVAPKPAVPRQHRSPSRAAAPTPASARTAPISVAAGAVPMPSELGASCTRPARSPTAAASSPTRGRSNSPRTGTRSLSRTAAVTNGGTGAITGKGAVKPAPIKVTVPLPDEVTAAQLKFLTGADAVLRRSTGDEQPHVDDGHLAGLLGDDTNGAALDVDAALAAEERAAAALGGGNAGDATMSSTSTAVALTGGYSSRPRAAPTTPLKRAADSKRMEESTAALTRLGAEQAAAYAARIQQAAEIKAQIALVAAAEAKQNGSLTRQLQSQLARMRQHEAKLMKQSADLTLRYEQLKSQLATDSGLRSPKLITTQHAKPNYKPKPLSPSPSPAHAESKLTTDGGIADAVSPGKAAPASASKPSPVKTSASAAAPAVLSPAKSAPAVPAPPAAPSDSKPASTPSAAPGPGPAGPRPMGPAGPGGPPRPPGPGAASAASAGPGGPPRPPGPGAAPAAPAGPGGLLAAIQGFKKDALKPSDDADAAASASSPSDSKPASTPSAAPGPGPAGPRPMGPAGPGGPPRPPGPGAAPAAPAGPGGPPRPPGPGAAPAAPGGLLAAIQGFKKDDLKQSDVAAAASASSPSDSKPASTPSAAPGPGPAGPRPMGPAGPGGPPRPPGPGAAPAGPGGPPRPPGPGAAAAAPAGPGGLLAAIQGFKRDEKTTSEASEPAKAPVVDSTAGDASVAEQVPAASASSTSATAVPAVKPIIDVMAAIPAPPVAAATASAPALSPAVVQPATSPVSTSPRPKTPERPSSMAAAAATSTTAAAAMPASAAVTGNNTTVAGSGSAFSPISMAASTSMHTGRSDATDDAAATHAQPSQPAAVAPMPQVPPFSLAHMQQQQQQYQPQQPLGGTPVVVMGPAGPVTMLMTAAGLVPMTMPMQMMPALPQMLPPPLMQQPQHPFGLMMQQTMQPPVPSIAFQPSTSPLQSTRSVNSVNLALSMAAAGMSAHGSPSISRGSRGLLAAPGSEQVASLPSRTRDDDAGADGPGNREGTEEEDGGVVRGGDADVDALPPIPAKPKHITPHVTEAQQRQIEEQQSRQAALEVEQAIGIGQPRPAPPTTTAGAASADDQSQQQPALKRRGDKPSHTTAEKEIAKKQDDSALKVQELLSKGAKAAPESGLGSFLYVKNSRFDASRPSPDNPRYWVGRVAEIMRGGRIRLHWHRETTMCSGQYVPTNNYFPERQSLLKQFTSVVFDPAARVWQAHPAVETMDEPAVMQQPKAGAPPTAGSTAATAGSGAASVSSSATAAAAAPAAASATPSPNEIAIGSFVFLRNARFKPETESPVMPRYWVARVTAINVQDPAAATPATPTRPGQAPALKQMLAMPDGRLRLQWYRETASSSALYTATSHIFFEHKRLLQVLPGGGLRFDSLANIWRRVGPVEEGSGAVQPLVFPGDEQVIAAAAAAAKIAAAAAPSAAASDASTAAAQAQRAVPASNAGAAVSAPAAPVPIEPGSFAFCANSRYVAGQPETPNAPWFWVARVLGVVPRAPGQPATRIKVQWHQEVASGSRLYRQTPKTFFESVAALRPLPGMVFDRSVSAWRLTQPFNEGGRYEDPEIPAVVQANTGPLATAQAPAPVPVPAPAPAASTATAASKDTADDAKRKQSAASATGAASKGGAVTDFTKDEDAIAQPQPQAQPPASTTEPRAISAIVKVCLVDARGLKLSKPAASVDGGKDSAAASVSKPGQLHKNVYAILKAADMADGGRMCTQVAAVDEAAAATVTATFTPPVISQWLVPATSGGATPASIGVEVWAAGDDGTPSIDAGASTATVHTFLGRASIPLSTTMHVPNPAPSLPTTDIVRAVPVSEASDIDKQMMSALNPLYHDLTGRPGYEGGKEDAGVTGEIGLRVWIEDHPHQALPQSKDKADTSATDGSNKARSRAGTHASVASMRSVASAKPLLAAAPGQLPPLPPPLPSLPLPPPPPPAGK